MWPEIKAAVKEGFPGPLHKPEMRRRALRECVDISYETALQEFRIIKERRVELVAVIRQLIAFAEDGTFNTQQNISFCFTCEYLHVNM